MKRKPIQTFFALALLVAFVADGANVLALGFPHRFVLQEASCLGHGALDDDAAHAVKRTTSSVALKFTDIDSPVVHAPEPVSNAFNSTSPPARQARLSNLALLKRPSLHQLCALLI